MPPARSLGSLLSEVAREFLRGYGTNFWRGRGERCGSFWQFYVFKELARRAPFRPVPRGETAADAFSREEEELLFGRRGRKLHAR